MGGKDNDASSLKVMPGYKIIAYRDNNFRGVKREYLPGNYDYSKFVGTLGNDKLSSVVVEKYTPGRCGPGFSNTKCKGKEK